MAARRIGAGHMGQYLIRTISGRELLAGQDLEELGCTVTIPLCTKQRRLRRFDKALGRMKQMRETEEYRAPILPSYIFGEIPDEVFHEAIESKHCIGQARALSAADMQDVAGFVKRAERGEFSVGGVYADLKPGQIMRLLDGMFADVLVTFKGVHGDKLTLEAPLMGQTVKFSVSVDDAEPVRAAE